MYGGRIYKEASLPLPSEASSSSVIELPLPGGATSTRYPGKGRGSGEGPRGGDDALLLPFFFDPREALRRYSAAARHSVIADRTLRGGERGEKEFFEVKSSLSPFFRRQKVARRSVLLLDGITERGEGLGKKSNVNFYPRLALSIIF